MEAEIAQLVVTLVAHAIFGCALPHEAALGLTALLADGEPASPAVVAPLFLRDTEVAKAGRAESALVSILRLDGVNIEEGIKVCLAVVEEVHIALDVFEYLRVEATLARRAGT